MKRLLLALALLAGLFVVAPTSVSASTPCGSAYGFTLYDGDVGNGASITFCGAYLPTGGPHVSSLGYYGWNDRVSSYCIWNAHSGSRFVAYEHDRYQGVTLTTTGGGCVYYLYRYWSGRFFDGFSNQMSSIWADG